MTLEQLILAHLDGQPFGSIFAGRESGPTASREMAPYLALRDLLESQHLLEVFREQLHQRLAVEGTVFIEERRAYSLGFILSLMMTMLDQMRAEINAHIVGLNEQFKA